MIIRDFNRFYNGYLCHKLFLELLKIELINSGKIFLNYYLHNNIYEWYFIKTLISSWNSKFYRQWYNNDLFFKPSGKTFLSIWLLSRLLWSLTVSEHLKNKFGSPFAFLNQWEKFHCNKQGRTKHYMKSAIFSITYFFLQYPKESNRYKYETPNSNSLYE